MNRALIMAVASVAGAGAFIWTLLARAPQRDGPVVITRPGVTNRMGRAPGMMAMEAPHDAKGLEEYVKNNPADYQAWMYLAAHRKNAGDDAGAREAWYLTAKTATEITLSDPGQARPWFCLAWARQNLGDADGAKAAFARAEPIYAGLINDRFRGMQAFTRLGWIRRGLGNETGANAAWAQGEELLLHTDPRDMDSGDLYNLACFRSLLGRPADALEALDAAVAKGWVDADWANVDEDLIPIAHDPRFAQIVERMRAVAAKP